MPSVRIGSDGRFGLPAVECARCGVPLCGLTRVIVAFHPEDYPQAALFPPAVLATHLAVSPRCNTAIVPRRDPVSHQPPAFRWGPGLIAHVLSEETVS